MAIVRSTWTSTPIPNDGMLPAAEWTEAGSLPVPGGFLMVKNDSANVYVALDVVNDTGNDVGTADYYWFVVDSDNNAAITVNRDTLYSPWPGQTDRLGRWLMAGSNATWPAANNQVLASTTRVGFGPSPNAAVSHRMWEIHFTLSELGITLDPTGPAPIIKFGLRLASSSPPFILETPTNPLNDFADFHSIILATTADSIYPAGTAGIVIGGVGLIPATKIDADGYATITEPYLIQPDDAAFGGTLNLIGNTATLPALWAAGARKYKVMHRFGNTAVDVAAASWTPIRQSWANFRWDGTTYVWESFGPDPDDMYPMVDPALDYSIKALLFQWDSSAEPNNIHQFHIDFFDAASTTVSATDQTLTLRLDNELPTVKLLNILHNGTPVAPCGIETMTDASDGVQIVFTASDPEGALYDYALTVEYGASLSATIASDSYAGHHSPTHIWSGVTNLTLPPSPEEWAPPVTCAYLFRIGATARVTNGYDFPYGYVSDFRTVTLIKPFIRIIPRPFPPILEKLPFGFLAPNIIQKLVGQPEQRSEETQLAKATQPPGE